MILMAVSSCHNIGGSAVEDVVVLVLVAKCVSPPMAASLTLMARHGVWHMSPLQQLGKLNLSPPPPSCGWLWA